MLNGFVAAAICGLIIGVALWYADSEIKRQQRSHEIALKGKDNEIRRLKDSLDRVNEDIHTFTELRASMSENCKPGEYCSRCLYSKTFPIRGYYDCRAELYCGKAEICKNFVQKEKEE